MKKWMMLFLLPACLAPALGAAEKFSLRISYGAAKIAPSDLNDFLADFVAIRRAIGYVLPAMKTLDWSDEFEITLSVPLDDHVSIFVSGGLIGAQQVGNDIDSTAGANGYTFQRNDRIRSIVARLGLSYAVPLSGTLTLRPHVSVDGHWSSFQDDGAQIYGWSDTPAQTELTWTADTTAFNFGYTLGVGLDFAVWSKLSLSVDAGWRRAKLSGFEGQYQETNFGDAAEPQNFRLFYYLGWVGWTYRTLNLPASYGGYTVRVIRDAALDLSGFYARAGIKISF
jgi:opacity protein-like surface antigen